MSRIYPSTDVVTSMQKEEGTNYFICPKTRVRYLECDTNTLVDIDW